MKKADIALIGIIITAISLLIIISGVFYFNLILNSSMTGHVIVSGNNRQSENEEIPVIDGKIIYSDNEALNVGNRT